MVIPVALPDTDEPDIRSYNHGFSDQHPTPAMPRAAGTTSLPAPTPPTDGGNGTHTSPSTVTEGSDDGNDEWVEPTYMRSFINMIRAVPILVIIPVILPVTWALHFTHQSPIAIFVTSVIGVMPLAGGIGFATEELAIRVGDAWGGLLNASFGNAVELLVAILALVKGDLDIVQASMAGSILSNVLLVLGMSYFAGGLRFHEQLYATVGAQTHISLLGISIAAVLLPEAFHLAFPSTRTGQSLGTNRASSAELNPEEMKTILSMSRGLSIMLLAVYGMFLCFQLWTHAYLFKATHEVHTGLPNPTNKRVFPKPGWVPSLRTVTSRDTWEESARSPATIDSVAQAPAINVEGDISNVPRRTSSHLDLGPAAITLSRSSSHSHSHGHCVPVSPDSEVRWREKSNTNTPAIITDRDVERGYERQTVVHHAPRARMWFAMGSLAVFTGLAGLTAECLVHSIDGLTERTSVSREFIGLIVLPLASNAVEHITAVTVSLKDRLNLSLSIAVGSSVQVSLCLLPLLVLIAWIIGQPLSLLFDTFETICLVIAVILVNFALGGSNRTNWLQGFVLMMTYIMIAMVTFFYDPAY